MKIKHFFSLAIFKKYSKCVPVLFALGFFVVSKGFNYFVFGGVEDRIAKNMLSLGSTHFIFVLILTVYWIKYAKAKVIKGLKDLYFSFYIMSCLQVCVYFAYAYTMIYDSVDLGIWFMDGRNAFLAHLIGLFTVYAAVFVELKTRDEYEILLEERDEEIKEKNKVLEEKDLLLKSRKREVQELKIAIAEAKSENNFEKIDKHYETLKQDRWIS